MCVNTASSQLFCITTAIPVTSFDISLTCSSFNPAAFPTASQSPFSGKRINIFVLVFLIAAISTAVGD